MKFINYEQGTAAWLAWRLSGLGGSDSSAIAGVSPYCTRRELFEIKRGLRSEPKPHPGMLEGIKREPEAREAYIQRTGIFVTPVCGESTTHPFLRRSFDGLSIDNTRAIEIKVTNENDHATALAGRVPEKYFCQITHGHIVAPTVATTDYVSYRPGCPLAIVPVPRNDEACQKLLAIETDFWNAVLKGILPLDDTLNEMLTHMRTALLEEQEIKARQESLRSRIIARIPKDVKRINQAGMLVTRKNLGAGVQYERLIESVGANETELDQYRVPGSFDQDKLIAKFGLDALRDCMLPGQIDYDAWISARGLTNDQVNAHYFAGTPSYQFRIQRDVPEAERISVHDLPSSEVRNDEDSFTFIV